MLFRSKILKQFKKRTGSGYVYEINVSLNEFNKILFEYDNNYYRYINNIEDDIIPSFTGIDLDLFVDEEPEDEKPAASPLARLQPVEIFQKSKVKKSSKSNSCLLDLRDE